MQAEHSLLVPSSEDPLEALPNIADALAFLGAVLQQAPNSNEFPRAEVGAGLLLEHLSYAIRDVHSNALENESNEPGGKVE